MSRKTQLIEALEARIQNLESQLLDIPPRKEFDELFKKLTEELIQARDMLKMTRES